MFQSGVQLPLLIVTADGVSSELVNVDPVHYKLAQSVGSEPTGLKNQGKSVNC